VGDLASKLPVSADKSMALEAGEGLTVRFISQPTVQPGMAQPFTQPVTAPIRPTWSHTVPGNIVTTPLLTLANPQAKLNEIISKYNTRSGIVPTAHVVSTNKTGAITNKGHAPISIQDFVRKLHQGSGFKVI
jgi:hypothetical protein